ncbi:unannotated protein [freshwater metagenome]|uniref:Unannotated protein n=1 Tax=freshwater metagenome TaxID=449393 RepID=A0A6J7CR57_9ZZZZ
MSRPTTRALNASLKRWPGWLLLVAVVVVALAIGATRSSGPMTDGDRIDSIAQRLACPTCDGESVYESQASAARGIKQQIKRFVEEGTSTDGQIIQYIQTQFGTKTLLVPNASGFDALVWALPAFALVVSIAGLTVAFRRWKLASDTVPTDDDRAMVAAALALEGELEQADGS